MIFNLHAKLLALSAVVLLALSACDDDDSNFITPKSNEHETDVSSSSSTNSSSSRSDKTSSSSVLDSREDVEIMPSGTYDCSKYKCITTEFLNQDFLEAGKYGEFLDKRDGQVYKTIQIGDQVWMAQNLNFNALMSSCYNDSTEYCEKYGRLYTWMSAMDTARVFTTNAKGCGNERLCDPALILPAQGVCPEGWHIPSSEELGTLIKAVGENRTSRNELQSKEGWCRVGGYYGGEDEFGFSAVATTHFSEGCGEDGGRITFFWSSSDVSYEHAKTIYIAYNRANRSSDLEPKKNANAVRCVKGYAQKDTSWKENSYAVVPSGTYDCTKYKCVTTEYLNQEFLESGKYGEVLDERDGHVYKTIRIGDQVWMAQNLNYESVQVWMNPDPNHISFESDSGYCYNDVQDSCDAMGRLYSWAHGRHLCPVRWRVASGADWEKLLDFVGDEKSLFSQSVENGTDPYGFSARISAEGNGDGYSMRSGSTAFWTSTNDNGRYAYRMDLNGVGLHTGVAGFKYPVRCIENDPADPD